RRPAPWRTAPARVPHRAGPSAAGHAGPPPRAAPAAESVRRSGWSRLLLGRGLVLLFGSGSCWSGSGQFSRQGLGEGRRTPASSTSGEASALSLGNATPGTPCSSPPEGTPTPFGVGEGVGLAGSGSGLGEHSGHL